MKEKLLGVNVSNETYNQLTEKLLVRMIQNKKSFIVAINPEKIMKAQSDINLLGVLNKADFQIPDGIGVIIASKIKGGRIRQRVTGIDLMLHLCETFEGTNKSIFLYGGRPGVAEKACDSLKILYPKIQIAGVLNGYEKDQQRIRDVINDANPDVLFVALGSPAQEYWIINNMEKLTATVYQGVGGSFDVISGRIKRAPSIFRRLGLEWLYRLMKEPDRWKRQIILPKFLIKVSKE